MLPVFYRRQTRRKGTYNVNPNEKSLSVTIKTDGFCPEGSLKMTKSAKTFKKVTINYNGNINGLKYIF
jgi:hypothetical protein